MLSHQQIQVTVMGLEGRDEYHKCYLRLGATQPDQRNGSFPRDFIGIS